MSTDDRQIRRWIQFACDRNEVPEFGQVIVVEWNRRFTRRLGDAGYDPIRFRARIRLSVPLWARATEQERRETVIHEACHCIVRYKHGVFDGNRRIKDHGPEWKQAMLNCGIEPLRTHNVDRTGLVRQQRLFVLLDCPKEEKCRISQRQYNRLQRGGEMWCTVCGLHLTGESAVEEDRTAAGSGS